MDAAIDEQAEKLKIARAVERHLHANKMSRSHLEAVVSARNLTDFFAGKFTPKTLTKIETYLDKIFATSDYVSRDASPELGSYSFRLVEHLQASYLQVRPLFGDATTFNAFIIKMRWDVERNCLTFHETERADKKYARDGVVYKEDGKPFLSLLAIKAGEVRNYLVSIPDDEGIARGIILTTHNPSGLKLYAGHGALLPEKTRPR